MPFLAAGVASLVVLLTDGEVRSLKFSVGYVVFVPMLLLLGLFLSIKSIPLIEERDDKDYAYSGLTVNIIFLSTYLISIIYFFL